MFTSYVKNKDS
jgi:hypothetical protein